GLARGGMRVALCDARGLGMAASGVNAGTLSMQTKRIPLTPYAIRGYALWKAGGDAVGFKETGSLCVAYTEREADVLARQMTARREAGAPIDLIGETEARAKEPNLRPGILAASYCAADGYANASLTGAWYRRQLAEAGAELIEHAPAQRIDPDDSGVAVHTPKGTLLGARALIATGAWIKAMSEALGAPIPMRIRVNTVSVTERMPALIHAVVAHASGLLSLKQAANGTLLIGGAWQGRGEAATFKGEVVPKNLVANLRLAQYVLPGLAQARIVRSWTGFEGQTPDFVPLAGPLPGAANVWVLGCVRSGYTIGPYIGKLMADRMLGRELELPLFDPARFFPAPAA
ncbi:MAG: FAD-dependent oxidoreductase, partial [Betaproteobacteria bacterium]